jgi:DNA-binding CsgD family transcriptional regulator
MIDSMEDICLCLQCPLPECVNCLGQRFGPGQATIKRLMKVKQMAEAGMTDKQMADVLGVHFNTVYQMRKKLGIPNYRDRTYGRAEARV